MNAAGAKAARLRGALERHGTIPRIYDRQAIPGITGGAVDSKEGEPGPILLQGDHGSVEFRKLTLTPAD